MFSGVLLEVLRTGAPDLPERLSLAQVGRCVEEMIRQRYPDTAVRPEVHSPDQQKGDLAKCPLFPNYGMSAITQPAAPPLHEIKDRKRSWRKSWVAVMVVAILAAVAIFVTLGYIAGIFGPTDVAERVRANVRPRASKASAPIQPPKLDAKGRRLTNFWFWIEAPDEIMREIETVTYRIPGYPLYQAIYPRKEGFKSGYEGVAFWQGDMDAILELRDGRKVTLTFNMKETAGGQ
jgi:hypothetical protein